MNKGELAINIKRAVDELINSYATCITIKLDDRLAVCVGWLNGYDEDDDTIIHDLTRPSWAINAGILVWTSDDMRTDYEYINAPYYDNGEVESTDVSISPDEDYIQLAKYFLDEYNRLKDLNIEKNGRIILEEN